MVEKTSGSALSMGFAWLMDLIDPRLQPYSITVSFILFFIYIYFYITLNHLIT